MATRSSSELEPIDITGFFGRLEDFLNETRKPTTAQTASIGIRTRFLEVLIDQGAPARTIRACKTYKTKLRGSNGQRGLISDEILYDETGKNPELPVAALPHKTFAELKAKAGQKLVLDLSRIERACAKELDYYFDTVARVRALRGEFAGLVDDAEEFHRSLADWEDVGPPRTEEQQLALIRHYLRVDAGFAPAGPWQKQKRTLFLHSRCLEDLICSTLQIPKMPFLKALRFEVYPPPTVLVACLLPQQIKTAWNVGAVLELTEDEIPTLEPPFSMQSVKTKTSDETPPVEIERHDTTVLRALKVLTARLSELKRRGLVPESERRLWVSSQRERTTKEVITLSNWSHLLKKFLKKHRLPDFSLEQIRNQVLSARALERNGPASASELAGHSSIATLTTYVEDILLSRLHDAGNLEYQNRLSASVKYAFDPLSVRPGIRLVPIGDGAACLDPTKPPFESWLSGTQCNAEQCHAGGGCPSRELEITPERIKEVVSLREYYMLTWKALLAKNVEQFQRIHLPAIEFNFALYGFLKRGPYGHLVT